MRQLIFFPMNEEFFKQVNYISTSKVSCSGVGSDSHPIVYLDLSSGNVVSCPYCGTKFLKK